MNHSVGGQAADDLSTHRATQVRLDPASGTAVPAESATTDTGGCKFVQIFEPPWGRNSSVSYSHQYDEDGEPSGDGKLRARLSPFSGKKGARDAIQITVYIVTGYHGKLRVPESFCRECHLFTRRAEQAIDQVDAEVSLSVRSWWTHFPWALRHGGYHAPVLIVGGKRLCQGHDVPTTKDVVAAIERAQNRE